jgi:hypothetical protein
MSMLDYLLWTRISGLRDRVADVHLRSQARLEDGLDDVEDELAVLRRDLDELALFSRTAVTLLIEKGVFTGEELVARMTEVDRSDGVEDGRFDDAGAPRP